MSLFGPPDISALVDKLNVNGLIKALRYKNDPQIRATAALALGSIGDDQTVPPLIDALKDQEWSVRRAAALALGQICGVEPDGLDASTRDELLCLGVRMDAAWRRTAQTGHKSPPSTDFGPISRAAQGGFGQLGRLENTDVEILMTEAVREGDVESLVALVAVRAFNHIIAALIAALADRQEVVRGAVARVLGEIGDARAVEPLKAARDDSSQRVRDNADYALKIIEMSQRNIEERRTRSRPREPRGFAGDLEGPSDQDLI